MTLKNTKFEVDDPGFYDSLISSQKKKLKRDKKNPLEWLELGRLQFEKKELTDIFVKKSIWIRWLPIITYVLIVLFLSMYINFFYSTLPLLTLFFASIILVFSTLLIKRTRHPQSGKMYFKKALDLDPKNGKAYVYLGLIALNQFQKQKACRYFEKALELGAGSKIERKLKTIYQKEFYEHFKQRSEREKQLYKSIEPLKKQNALLEQKLSDLENKNISFSKKITSTKARTTQELKKTKSKMAQKLSEIQSDYEQQLAALEHAMEEEQSQKEAAQKKNINLSLEVFEAKTMAKKESFHQCGEKVKSSFGDKNWLWLSKSSRSFITTAEQAFSMLDKESNETDFSLIGMELCKALETEINNKLVQPFSLQLNRQKESFLKINQTGEVKGFPLYYTMLAKVVDDENYPDIKTLTLGQYLFVLKKTLEGEVALDEYGSFLDNLWSVSNVVIGRKFLQKLRVVTQDYRNSIVHNTKMDSVDCQKVRELILYREDALLKTISRIKIIN
jgi:tetratricopeptide (TPR) repeat protein